MIPWLNRDSPFPPLEFAMEQPNGLLCVGGDLSPARLLQAYRQGIFPWYSDGDPILWWSPDPRMVLFPCEMRVTRSLGKVLRNRPYEVRFDTAFDAVVAACAEPRSGQNGTWITDDVREAYGHLHRLGHAHSAETWIDGELAGGLYGVSLGGVFFGESMFMRESDASKIAFVHLVRWMSARGCLLVDCQMHTGHLASLGAREIPRAAFLQHLSELVDYPAPVGPWDYVHANLAQAEVRSGPDVKAQ